MTTVDDVVAARIAEARRRTEAAKQRRVALNAARQYGLVSRYRAKLAELDRRQSDSTKSAEAADVQAADIPVVPPPTGRPARH
ncbi:hypothetical protein [Streptomyces sp. PH10-H1]|uniref:hypothetical protein n=1 Tax=Streptomyces sp. PH10-H1 TaxID=3046212 RepID=UPI0024B9E90D|nr:hypothetical protein [Streptomyces sp. PH10-H1]MDJ0341782.1 hypothetical protein [Streptomyces sp. PH10-H1]